jgi:hypothetical protein
LRSSYRISCPESDIEVVEKRDLGWSVVYGLNACGVYKELEERFGVGPVEGVGVTDVREFALGLAQRSVPERIARIIPSAASASCEKREIARRRPTEDVLTSEQSADFENLLKSIRRQCEGAPYSYLGSSEDEHGNPVWFFDADGTVVRGSIETSTPSCAHRIRTRCVPDL